MEKLSNSNVSASDSATGILDRMRTGNSRLRLLLIVVLISVVISVAAVSFRFSRGKFHDPGFSRPNAEAAYRFVRPPGKRIVSAPGQFMTLDASGKFLMNSITGKPVFVSGDSAWSLITQLSDEDADHYLQERAALGFNYIWCAAADNYFQSNAPRNFYGDQPFDGPDFTNEGAHYWAHLDNVVQMAASHGITVALDPGFAGLPGAGAYVASYQASSEGTLRAYGEFLGKRYAGFPNIIWALGGDVYPETGVLPKIVAIAQGIRGEDSVHLMVAEGEPQHSSLETFQNSDWLDLNWLYFHRTNIPLSVSTSYSVAAWLPPFLGEGEYENVPSLTELELREQGYWGVLSGAYLGNAGFGNSPLWYFNGGPEAHAGEPSWQSQLRSAGSMGEMHLADLFRSREHWLLQPDVSHAIMIAGYDSRTIVSSTVERLRSVMRQRPYRLGSQSSVAARTSDGQTVIAYMPNGSSAKIVIAMSDIVDTGSQARCWWFNPRDGGSIPIGVFSTTGAHSFIPPDNKDWVLVIDSLAANLPAPGSRPVARTIALQQPSSHKSVGL